MQYYPVVIQSGNSVAGDSLGFHAYSLRIDNLTNQWLLEETSLAWIPPYSLGVCLRLYGTGVAIILNRAPIGQPQLNVITGEQAIGVYSDQLRTEVAGTPVRQFSAVQAVSDLTQGPVPATPPAGITRLYANTNGSLSYILPNATTVQLVDANNITPYITGTSLGGDLSGTVNNGRITLGATSTIVTPFASGNVRRVLVGGQDNRTYLFTGGTGWYFYNESGTGTQGAIVQIDNTGALALSNNTAVTLGSTGSTIFSTGYIQASGGTYYFDGGRSVYLYYSGSAGVLSTNQGMQATYFAATNSGYIFYLNAAGAANSIYMDNNQIQFAAPGGVFNFSHWGIVGLTMTVGSPSSSYTSFTGGANQMMAPQWLISGSSYSYIAAGRSGNELSANVHLYVPGNIVAGGTITPSTRAIKRNIAIISDSECLARVTSPSSNPVTYQPLNEVESGPDILPTTQIGFIAEDMVDIVPEAIVTHHETGDPSGILYNNLEPLLWGGLRELERRVRRLELGIGPQ